MYGLVNKAVEGLVVSNFGEKIWEQIKQKASVDVEMFISNDSYPDSMTYELLMAAAEILDQPASELLRLLGHYWISDVAVEHYGAMMDAGGSTFHDFLRNLPNFHLRVHMIFPNLEPPVFRLTNESDNRMELVYESKRGGLEMFVVGLLEGLGKRYNVKLDICQKDYEEADSGDGYNQKLFVIQWYPNRQ